MKTIIRILIVLAILISFAYFGMAQKAHKVKELRMKVAFQKGKISEKEYHQYLENYKFMDTLLNPKFVLSVD